MNNGSKVVVKRKSHEGRRGEGGGMQMAGKDGGDACEVRRVNERWGAICEKKKKTSDSAKEV